MLHPIRALDHVIASYRDYLTTEFHADCNVQLNVHAVHCRVVVCRSIFMLVVGRRKPSEVDLSTGKCFVCMNAGCRIRRNAKEKRRCAGLNLHNGLTRQAAG